MGKEHKGHEQEVHTHTHTHTLGNYEKLPHVANKANNDFAPFFFNSELKFR